MRSRPMAKTSFGPWRVVALAVPRRIVLESAAPRRRRLWNTLLGLTAAALAQYGAVVLLASAASDYLHGVVLPVDGGWLAR